MSEFRNYEPTEAEMQLAEKSMTKEQKQLSKMRETVNKVAEFLNVDDEDFALGLFVNNDQVFFGMSPEEVKKYVQETFDYLTSVGKDPSTVDAGKVLGHNMTCMSADAAFALGEALGATEADWKDAISEFWDFHAEFCEIELEELDKLNAICQKIGFPEIANDDKKVKEILFLDIVDGRLYDDLIMEKLTGFGLGFITFLNAFNNTNSEKFEDYSKVKHIVDLYVSRYCMEARSIDEIEDRLKELGLVDNAIINIGNILAELDRQLQVLGECFNENSEYDFATFLSIQRILGRLDLKADWVKRVAQHLSEGFFADQARSALLEKGFDLIQLAGADKTVMLEVDQQSLEDMFGES